MVPSSFLISFLTPSFAARNESACILPNSSESGSGSGSESESESESESDQWPSVSNMQQHEAQDDLEAELMDLESNLTAYLPENTSNHMMNRSESLPAHLEAKRQQNRTLGARADSVNALNDQHNQLQSQPYELPVGNSSRRTSSMCEVPYEAATAPTREVTQRVREMLLRSEQQSQQQHQQHQQPLQKPGGNGVVANSAVASTLPQLTASEKKELLASLIDKKNFVIQQKLANPRLVQALQAVRFNGASDDQENGAINDQFAVDQVDLIVNQSVQEMERTNSNRELLWTSLMTGLSRTEGDVLARSADEMFEERMKYCRHDPEISNELIRKHLENVFQMVYLTRNGQSVARTMNHSLGVLLKEFCVVFHAVYKPFLIQTTTQELSETEKDQFKALLCQTATDVHQFSCILGQVMLFKYHFLEEFRETVQGFVIEALFQHLQPTLHGLYAIALEQVDYELMVISSKMSARSAEEFGIKPIFRLDGSWSVTSSSSQGTANQELLTRRTLEQYRGVVNQMNTLPTFRSPWVKLSILATICRDIDDTIKGFYKLQTETPSLEDLSVTADDLCSLLAFILSRSPPAIQHLGSQMILMGSFLPPHMAAREEGFALATLTLSVRHLCRMAGAQS